ncbi:MAG: SPFH domain-containing protein [Candidatus Dojkabacteria bacterium]|jgi:regulator of protease activity HflC (stomatin/prohibitin superfamily)
MKRKISLIFVLSVLVLSLLLSGCSSVGEVDRTRTLGSHPIWFLVTLVVFIGIGWVLFWRFGPDMRDTDLEKEKYKKIRILVAVLLPILFITLQFVIGGFVTIDQTEVGVVTRLGKAIEIGNPGLRVLIPYVDRVVVFSKKQWTYSTMIESYMETATDDYIEHPASLVTLDNVQVSVTYTVIGQIIPEKVIHIYENFGSLDEAVEKAVQATTRIIVRQKLKDFTAKQIYLEVDNVDATVEEELSSKMQEAGLELVFFGFRKPTLGIKGDYEIQLNEEMVAAQTALVAEKYIDVEKALAEQAVVEADGQKRVAISQAEARAAATRAEQEAIADAALYTARQQAEEVRVRADAEAYRIAQEAKARAQANELIAIGLTPNLIEYIKLMQWNGVLPQFSGVNGGILISPQ